MLYSLYGHPEITILDMVPLRRDTRAKRNIGEICHDQDKLVNLVGINFHRALNAEKMQMQFKG